jgi:hypothetical protein
MEVSGQLQAPAALPLGKNPWYPLDRRLDGPQSRSGRGGEEKKIPSPRWELNPRTPIVQPIAQRYTDWVITALIKHCSEYKSLCELRQRNVKC